MSSVAATVREYAASPRTLASPASPKCAECRHQEPAADHGGAERDHPLTCIDRSERDQDERNPEETEEKPESVPLAHRPTFQRAFRASAAESWRVVATFGVSATLALVVATTRGSPTGEVDVSPANKVSAARYVPVALGWNPSGP